MIAENVKNIIKEKGYKQNAIASRIGMNEKSFNALLNGRKIFDSKYVVPISEALGVTPNDLFKISQ